MSDLTSTLAKYQKIYNQAELDVKLEAKTIQEACMEHASLYLYYYDKLCELKRLSTNIQIELDRLKGVHSKKYNENYSIKLGERMMSKYVDSEPEIIKVKMALAEVIELLNKFEGVKESFVSRGYQLGSITKQRVAMVEEGLL